MRVARAVAGTNRPAAWASRRFRIALWLTLSALGAVLLAASVAGGHSGPHSGLAYSIAVDGTIDPATERWVEKGLTEAAEREADVAIIRLDTPGGLDSSMRSIVKDIIAAPMPVIVYVYPDGARAASAGLFITLAGDVAAMSPQTNIGSATPISLTGGDDQEEVLGRKVRNDAAAYVRALAQGHGRNADLAEEMVREAANVTATEAERRDLIDIVARSEQELLTELDGRRIEGPKEQELETEGLEIERHDMPLHLEILQLLVNPTIAVLLLTAGLAGIAIEVFNPGLIAPGTFGAIAFILGLYGTAQLPVTAAGIVLLALALGLFVAETQMPSGIFGGAGILALIAGFLLLFDTGSDALEISAPVVIAVGVLLGGFTLFLARKAVAARHGPVKTGWEEMLGETGDVRVALDPVGQVYVQGALWRARAAQPDTTIPKGDRVKVEEVDGLTLIVTPVDEAPAGAPTEEESPA